MPANNNDDSVSRFAGQVWDGLGWFASGLPHAVGDLVIKPGTVFRNATSEWWNDANSGNVKKLPEGATVYRNIDPKTGERNFMVKLPGQDTPVKYDESMGVLPRDQLRALQTTAGGFRGENERHQTVRAAAIANDYQLDQEVDRTLRQQGGLSAIKKTEKDDELARTQSLDESRQRHNLALGDQKIQGEEKIANIRETGATQRQTIASGADVNVANINAGATMYGYDSQLEAKKLDFKLGNRAEDRLSLDSDRQHEMAGKYFDLSARKQSSDEEYRNTVLGIQERNNRLNLIAQIFGNTTNNLASSITAPYANLRF